MFRDGILAHTHIPPIYMNTEFYIIHDMSGLDFICDHVSKSVRAIRGRLCVLATH